MRPFVLIAMGIFLVLGCNGQSADSKTAKAASTVAPTTSGSTAAPTTSSTVVVAAPPPKKLSLDVATGPRNPAAAQVAPGVQRVVALQVRLASASDLDVTSLQLTPRGTSVPSRDFPTVELAVDQDGDGAFTAKDKLVGAAAWGAPFTNVASLRGGAAVQLLVLVTTAPAAQVGATLDVTLDARDVTAVDASGGSLTFSPSPSPGSGAPAAPATITVTGSAVGSTITILGPQTPDTWRTRAKMPTARRDIAAAATVAGIVHAIGGRAAAGITGVNEAYDPRTDRWTTLAPLATARALAAAATLGGKIYVVGGTSNGTDALASVEAYDPATDKWRTVAPLPQALRDTTAVAHAGQLWVTGGNDGTTPSGASFVYDAAANAWTAGPTVVTSTRTGTSAAGWVTLIDNNSQIFWGPGGPASTLPAPGAFAQSAYVGWDFALRASAVTIGTRVYCVGGVRGAAAVGEVKSMDMANVLGGGTPATHASMIVRDGPGVALAGGKVYALGGEGGQLLDTNEEYAP